MRFRPCIDIHDGCVKQIVGGSLTDSGKVDENYVSDKGGEYYADLYKRNNLPGGHIIILNKAGTEEYEASKQQALRALKAYPGHMQIGGGINADNAGEFIEAGAGHVVVTSYIFTEVKLDFNKLNALRDAVGAEHIVIDLSCRQKNGRYYVVTDRWQTFTEVEVCKETFDMLADYCDEFLIHGVDVEGMRQGIDEKLLRLIAKDCTIPVTYAGGIRDIEDIKKIEEYSSGAVDFTIGSALDIFGGKLAFDEVVAYAKRSHTD